MCDLELTLEGGQDSAAESGMRGFSIPSLLPCVCAGDMQKCPWANFFYGESAQSRREGRMKPLPMPLPGAYLVPSQVTYEMQPPTQPTYHVFKPQESQT